MRKKLTKLIEKLNHGLVGREETIKLSLLTLLTGENTVLFGPPGTAKSEISRRISQVIDNGEYFEYLLTKFTTPEEIFGPLSINELKQDRFKRNTDGYMPKSNTAFLDEIFKANSSILNSLLTIINEKTFHNGNIKEKAPLISLIGASNELPIDDSELNALYDRFLTRILVTYVNDKEIDKLFDLPSSDFAITEGIKIDREEIQKIKNGIDKIGIPLEIRELIKNIRSDFNEKFKENKNENISDRKLVKVLKILKVSAFTNGRKNIDISDVMLLKHCLWNNPDNLDEVGNLVVNNIKNTFKIEEEKLFESTNPSQNNSKKRNFDFDGEGTENSPFLIEDEGDLIHMGSEAYTDKGYYFKLVNDITISSEWHSIANFIGNYDGNNHKVIGLHNALFGNISDTSLNNIVLEKVSIGGIDDMVKGLNNTLFGNTSKSHLNNIVCEKLLKNGRGEAGGIVNKIVGGKCIINNCNIEGTISSSSSSGGIIGAIEEGSCEIINCSVDGSVTSYSDSDTSSGGILGYIQEGNCEIINCNIDGNVTSSISGGVLGGIRKGVCSINNCNVNGNIISAEESISPDFPSGGIVGYMQEGSCEIINCNIDGNVTSAISGGILGNIREGNCEIINCNVDGKVTSPSSSFHSSTGGILGSITGGNCKIINCSVDVIITIPYSTRFPFGGILGYFNCRSLKLINNYISNTSTLNEEPVNSSDENSKNGKSLDPSQFNGKFYRRLGWDLDDTWKWDKAKNKPVLIDCGYFKKGSKKNKIKSENIVKIEQNELSQILNNNIWL